MALSPVSEESPNYKEEPDNHDSFSDAPSYSDNSFESFTDGSHGRCKSDGFGSSTDEHTEKYQSDSFESSASESSCRHETVSFNSITKDSRRNYESESFESLSSEVDQTYSSESSCIESASVEDDYKTNGQGKGLIEKWIKSLVDGNLRPNNSLQDHLKTVAHKESSGSGSKALQSYCSLKIEHLHQPSKCCRQKKGRPHPSKAISINQSCPVPPELMNRLKLQHIKETVNQVIKTEMHDPANCPDCCTKQAELAQGQFIRMKKTKLEAGLLNKKMEDYMYSKDLVTCIGEILQSLPKPSVEQNVI